MTSQELIDTIGKLGPLSVAIAVFVASLMQNRWVNSVGRRAAGVEDQKLRLALLERRAAAIDSIRNALQEVSAHEQISSTLWKQIFDALLVAQLVFDEDHENAIVETINLLQRWQTQEHYLAALDPDANEQREVAVQELMKQTDTVFGALSELLQGLLNASRVTIPPPL